MKYARKWHGFSYRQIPTRRDHDQDAKHPELPRASGLVDGGAIVTTPSGEAYFAVTGDGDTGVLDRWSGLVSA